MRQDGLAYYREMTFDVWLAVIIFPVVGVFIATGVNVFDVKSYRRYIQFLRLEFDTKLGMHSPK